MSPTDTSRRVVVLETDPVARQRIGRALTASSNLEPAATIGDVLDFERVVGPATRHLIVPDAELDLGVHYLQFNPKLELSCIARTVESTLISTMQAHHTLNHLVGWAEHDSVPRLWDLSLIVGAVRDRFPNVSDIVPTSCGEEVWRPQSSEDRDLVVERVTEIVEHELQDGRLASAVGEVAYEMLMNAMYDAPVTPDGSGKYRQDRAQDVKLEPQEIPTFRLATDGALVVLEVTDPFGGLRREEVLDSLSRGLRASNEDAGEVLNTKFGGAGLGMFRMYQQSTALICASRPGQMTRVICVFDLDLRSRDRRSFPTSLHLFLPTQQEAS